MPIDPFHRLNHFVKELPAGGPASWSVDILDRARARLNEEIDDRLFHLQVAKNLVMGVKWLPEDMRQLHSWLTINVRSPLITYRHAMPRAVRACYLGLAGSLLDAGDTTQASLAIRRVLTFDPSNQAAHTLLDEFALRGFQVLAKELRSQYHFNYIKSFGKSKIHFPVSIIIPSGSRELVVSNHMASHVTIFSLGGRFKREIHLDLDRPGSLEEEGDGTLWICDKHNARLTRFHPVKGIVERMPVFWATSRREKLFPNQIRKIGHRRFVCLGFCPARNVVLAGILTTSGFTPYVGLTGSPAFLRVIDGQACTRDHYTGDFTQHSSSPPITGLPIPLKPAIPANFSFLKDDAGWFMDVGGRALAHYSTDGELVYIAHLGSILGENGLVFDLVRSRVNDRHLIYCADGGSNCIRVFQTGS